MRPDEVMPLAARSADLGVHFTPLDIDQRRFLLPNELFDYIGAELVIAVSRGVDLRAVVVGHGVVSRDISAEAAVEAMNVLTQVSVAAFTAAARAASAELFLWKERETQRAALAPPMAPM